MITTIDLLGLSKDRNAKHEVESMEKNPDGSIQLKYKATHKSGRVGYYYKRYSSDYQRNTLRK